MLVGLSTVPRAKKMLNKDALLGLGVLLSGRLVVQHV